MKKRYFVSPKNKYDFSSLILKESISHICLLPWIKTANIYDIFNLNMDGEKILKEKIIADPFTDTIREKIPLIKDSVYFAFEYLPAQYDNKSDAVKQCYQLFFPAQNIVVKTAMLIFIPQSHQQYLHEIKAYLINPIECREKQLHVFSQPSIAYKANHSDIKIENFVAMKPSGLKDFIAKHKLSMNENDLLIVQKYYISKNENPSLTEIKVIDTYWSDHCRHSTFFTRLNPITIKGAYHQRINDSFKHYEKMRESLGIQKPISLMDLATITAKYQQKTGFLNQVEQTDEVNACSVRVKVKHNEKLEDWLLMFKNETHNHPTEIEPFGGAATCLGGAIRDPLSGRSFVFQGVRVSGAADLLSHPDDIAHKLPQKKIISQAAKGFSSYGNQFGISTTLVNEIFHSGYRAKRMEVGMVVGAVPQNNVIRMQPEPGDAILLIGGRTGKDGIGGATGSSKVLKGLDSIRLTAEVQKGNPLEERKLLRLFRQYDFTHRIKRSNDLGAGGLAVAAGELGDGVKINLDNVRLKYEGLDGNDIALSESQERMLVLVERGNVEAVCKLAHKENLQAYQIGEITASPVFDMQWKNKSIVKFDRSFINSNGAARTQSVQVDTDSTLPLWLKEDVTKQFFSLEKDLQSIDYCAREELIKMFDNSVGSASVLMPLGGINQSSPEDVSVQLFPVSNQTTTCSVVGFSTLPSLACFSCYHAGLYAVLESVCRLVAAGVERKNIFLSFQEYFQKLGNNALVWGKPFACLLGALEAQDALKVASIGGKDSMSGSFENIHVPPTFISFAVGVQEQSKIISATLSKPNSYLYLLALPCDKQHLPIWEQVPYLLDRFGQMHAKERFLSAKVIVNKNIAITLAHMGFGNMIGAKLNVKNLPNFSLGSMLIESDRKLGYKELFFIGKTCKNVLQYEQKKYSLLKLKEIWQQPLKSVYGMESKPFEKRQEDCIDLKPSLFVGKKKVYKNKAPLQVKVCIPVFPGSNGDYDGIKSFQRQGAKTIIPVFRNQDKKDIKSAIQQLAKGIEQAEIFYLAGGFTCADQPDGSGKFLACLMEHPSIQKSILGLLQRDGLILGICNGFQALLRSGLLPGMDFHHSDFHTCRLLQNGHGRHVAQIVWVKVKENSSPWLQADEKGAIYSLPISHSEGRFEVKNLAVLKKLKKQKLIATQYVNLEAMANNNRYNPNDSLCDIEGITSVCGRIYGRMGHADRYSKGCYHNIPNFKHHNIFKSGIQYFNQ